LNAGTFSFTVNPIVNPFSAKPWTGFEIYTLDSAGKKIEYYYSATYTVTTPVNFGFINLGSPFPSTIGSKSLFTLSFGIFDFPIDSSC
jgi:hypothetical protein